MKDFRGKVAVITGAASGIGAALASRFGSQGARIVLADIEVGALEKTARELEKHGVETQSVVTDVSQGDQVQRLADRALETFGAVHLVFNNAGVFAGGLAWQGMIEDYEWVLGVNTWGVIHGIRTFVPILLEQDCEAHIVNTASMAALTSAPYSGIYTMSKHAVLGLSECLYHELTLRGSKVGVSVLCPEAVDTGIGFSERNRPEHLKRSPDGEESPPEQKLVADALREATGRGTHPEGIAERVYEAIYNKRFYILSDDAWRRTCAIRLEDIRLGRNPTFAIPGSEF